MKILLTFPPLWGDLNSGPMLSLPILASMLLEEGHQVSVIDINAHLVNFVMSKDFSTYFCDRVSMYRNEIDKDNNLKASNAPQEELLDSKLREYYKDMIHLYEKYCKNFSFTDKYGSIRAAMKDLFNKDVSEFNNLCIMLKGILNKIMKKKYTENVPKKYLLLTPWEEEVILPMIKDFNPDIIGFSIYISDQYFWSNSFCELLEENTEALIVYGGSQVAQMKPNITTKDFKNRNCIMIYGEGENAFTELAKGTPLSKIPSIIYINKRNKVKINPQKNKTNSSRIKFYKPNYSNMNLDNYFVLEPVLTIESSRGCYWHKCKFCSFMDCISYKIKPVDDLIEEIREYVNKYHINHFFFTDPCIHPNYAKEFSQKLIENNLKIYYVAWLRLEKEFDYETLKLMYDGGLRVVLWGLESGSDRILKLYNKGTKSKNNAKVLKNAHKAGIFNYCWVITQFAGETEEDLKLTHSFLSENFENIDYVGFHIYTLMPNSPIAARPEEFGLTKEDFKIAKSYRAPINIAQLSDKLVLETMDKYKEKMESYFENISYTLLKVSQEKP